MHTHTVDPDRHRLLLIRALLTSPLAASILKIHPNDLCSTGDWESDTIASSEWNGWWHWAANEDNNDNGEDEKWIKLVQFYNEYSSERISNNPSDIPSDLRDLIAKIKSLQLDRTPHLHPIDAGLKHSILTEIPTSRGKLSFKLYTRNLLSIHFHGLPLVHTYAPDLARHARFQARLTPTCSPGPGPGYKYGMSPKKTHEVTNMLAYISRLLGTMPASIEQHESMRHIVDVGAGQVRTSLSLVSHLSFDNELSYLFIFQFLIFLPFASTSTDSPFLTRLTRTL